MHTFNINDGHTSRPRVLGAGQILTVTASAGYAVVEYATGSLQDALNNAVQWLRPLKGDALPSNNYKFDFNIVWRVTPIGGNAVLVVDEAPSALALKNYLENESAIIPQIYVGNPPGLFWLQDTLNGVDLYNEGFVLTPTIYFDPSQTAATSQGLGTLAHPYYTQAQVQAVCAGDMSGQVLGIKRGTTLRVTGVGLKLDVYGKAGKPFTICPYGDPSLPLPIITGGVIVSAWTLVDAGANIWSNAMGATEYDVWQKDAGIVDPRFTGSGPTDLRLLKKAFSGSALATLTTDGTSTYNASTIYIRPANGIDPRLNNAIEFAVPDAALNINYSNVAATGYIHVVGLDARKGRNSSFVIGAPVSLGSITTLDDIRVVGCRSGQAGADIASPQACDAFIVYGATDAVRLTNLYIAGNYAYDSLNNAYEIAGTSGALIEKNIAFNCGGNLILEAWSSNDNITCRYNYGDFSVAFGHVSVGFACGGVWSANNYYNAGSWANNDATNAKNFNHNYFFNLVTRPGFRGLRFSGGTGHKAYHNTFVYDEDSTNPTAPIQQAQSWFTEGTGAAGFVDISNNIFVYKPSVRTDRFPRMGQVNDGSTAYPKGDRNVYFANYGNGSSVSFRVGGATVGFAAYKTALAGAPAMDQNAYCTTNYGGGLTAAALGFNYTTNKPLAASCPGLTALASLPTKYYDGTPYIAASSNSGCLLGT